MRLHLLLLVATLANLALACAETERYSPLESQLEEEKVKLRTVIHTVDIDHDITFSNSNTWQQFPDFKIKFDLKYRQFVKVEIQINLWTTNVNCHYLTRLIVDGVEDRRFRSIMGNSGYVSFSLEKELWLEKGKHDLRVEYRSLVSARY